MQKENKHIIIEKYDSYWQVWLNRPEKHNALNDAMLEGLTDIFNSVDETKTRVLVLRGKGKSFCAGADLSWMKNIENKTFEENKKDSEKLAKLLNTIYNLPVPVISVVQGSAFGGALGLMAASDFVFAEENASFSFSEVRLGLSPSTIMPYVINKIGKNNTKELIFTGKVFGTAEALETKLVDKVLPRNEIENKIKIFVGQIKKTAPGAVKESKLLINKLNGEINQAVIDFTVDSLTRMRTSSEAQKGIKAFFNKTEVTWD